MIIRLKHTCMRNANDCSFRSSRLQPVSTEMMIAQAVGALWTPFWQWNRTDFCWYIEVDGPVFVALSLASLLRTCHMLLAVVGMCETSAVSSFGVRAHMRVLHKTSDPIYIKQSAETKTA